MNPSFTGNLASAAAGQLSSLLMAELADTLHLHGIQGALFQSVGTTITGRLVDNIFHVALDIPHANGSAFTLFEGFSPDELFTSMGTAVGGVLGNALASLVIMPHNHEEAIGASLGSSVGAWLGTTFIPIPVLGTALGSFLGDILGDLVGSLFGGPAASTEGVLFDPATGGLMVTPPFQSNGGNAQYFFDIAHAQVDTVNGLLAFAGARIEPSHSNPVLGFTQNGTDYWLIPILTLADSGGIPASVSE